MDQVSDTLSMFNFLKCFKFTTYSNDSMQSIKDRFNGDWLTYITPTIYSFGVSNIIQYVVECENLGNNNQLYHPRKLRFYETLVKLTPRRKIRYILTISRIICISTFYIWKWKDWINFTSVFLPLINCITHFELLMHWKNK